jgi:hypothetical protein
MLRNIAAHRERRRLHSPSALRCVSKHEGELNRTSSSFETRARACKFAECLRIRAPQDEDEQRVLRNSPYKQPPSFPRRIFAPGGLRLCFTNPESRGGRSAEKRSGARRNTRGHAVTRRTRRLRGALRPMTRDARLSALHRGGFGLRGRASLTGICAGLDTASSSHPGRSAWRAGSRASRGQRLRAAAAGRHASLRIRDRLENTPSMSEAAYRLA